MGRFNSKAKGSAYERVVVGKIAKAFEPFGICVDDCYRTKNSGSTQDQPSDLWFSPALNKLFPALVEAKHYRTIKYKLGKSLSHQPKSYEIKAWWKQVKREERTSSKRFGLLVMRENNSEDICAFSPRTMDAVFDSLSMLRISFTRYTFDSLYITHYRDEEIWIVKMSEFLQMFTIHFKWYCVDSSKRLSVNLLGRAQ